MNPRALAAWSASCVGVALVTTNPAYRLIVLAAALSLVLIQAGARRSRRLLLAVATGVGLTALLNFVASRLGADVLFQLPTSIPALGGTYTLEAMMFGLSAGLTLAAVVLAVAPLTLCLEPHQVVDALPPPVARTGAVLAASLNLVGRFSRSLSAVADAQRMRGWRPRGPRSLAEVVVPAVLTAIEDSIQVAESMEARAYGSGRRTSYEPDRWRGSDTVVAVASLGALAGLVGCRGLGIALDWSAYPYVVAPLVSLPALGACALLFAPVLAWR